MNRNNGGASPFVTGPNSLSTGGNSGDQLGYRMTLGGSFGAYDVEAIGSQVDGWSSLKTGTLTNPLVFDDTANNPVVVAAPPANTLAFTNSLFDAATLTTVEDNESERLKAGAKYAISGSSQFQDYQVNFGTNPTQNPWRVSLGYRHMRLSEGSTVGITGTFDALDTATGVAPGGVGNIGNDGLDNSSLTSAGYSLNSGTANGFSAAGIPSTLKIYDTAGARNILNGVQLSTGYRLFPDSLVKVELFGRGGLFHNYMQAKVGEALVGSGSDNSVYTRSYSASRNGFAFGGTLGAKAVVPVTDYISLTAGYEATYLANVALASAQFGGLSNTALGSRQYRVQNHDNFLMHGVTVGMLLTW